MSEEYDLHAETFITCDWWYFYIELCEKQNILLLTSKQKAKRTNLLGQGYHNVVEYSRCYNVMCSHRTEVSLGRAKELK